jgi:hypothetical protein
MMLFIIYSKIINGGLIAKISCPMEFFELKNTALISLTSMNDHRSPNKYNSNNRKEIIITGTNKYSVQG